MKQQNIIGIDLAKNVIQACVIDKQGELTSNKAMPPKKLKEMLAKAKCLYWVNSKAVSRLPDTPKTVKQSWLIDLVRRAGIKRACIALANKTVRTAWALLSTGKKYQPVLLPV